MRRTFNENTRVQVPAAVHLCRLGYSYYGALASEEYDATTNILTRKCAAALVRLNPGLSQAQALSFVQDLVRVASNDDLGRAFYQRITSTTGVRYIDFETPDANEWGCTTEFECENPETHDCFRPDITCFVNGLPLAFVEVKIPNNREGILAERARMNQRTFLRDFEIDQIVDTFVEKKAEDGFSVVVSHDEIAAKGYSLSAGQYFDVKIEHVDITADEFRARMAAFTEDLEAINAESAALDREIAAALKKLEFAE